MSGRTTQSSKYTYAETQSEEDSGDEFDEAKRPSGWFARFRSRLALRKPKWWTQRKGPMVQAKEAIREAMWRPNPRATVDDLKQMARGVDEPKMLEHVIATLEQENFWKPGEAETFAINAVAETIESPSETFVKAWVLVKINERNHEQERVLVLTDQAYYTASYSYDKDKVTRVRRHNLLNYVAVNVGLLYKHRFTQKLMGTPSKENQVYGLTVTLKVPGANAIAKKVAELKGHDHVMYTRAFRVLSTLKQSEQKKIALEVAWAMYAVANLSNKYWEIDEPVECDLYRPMGSMLTLAKPADVVPERKKRALVERKAEDLVTGAGAGSSVAVVAAGSGTSGGGASARSSKKSGGSRSGKSSGSGGGDAAPGKKASRGWSGKR